MNLKSLSDASLLTETKRLVGREREILTEVLHHLREIDKRRLYSSLRYKSLFDYATKELGYGEDQAYRRINAMRCLREMPQLEEKIAGGSLTLSQISLATSIARAEGKAEGKSVPLERKLELMEAVAGKSRREAEAVIARMTVLPKELVQPESMRALDDKYIEMRFVSRKSLELKMSKIKNWLAHSNPNLSTAELFEKLCDEYIERREKSDQRARIESARSSRVEAGTVEISAEITSANNDRGSCGENRAFKKPRVRGRDSQRKYISVHLRRAVMRKAEYRCEACRGNRALEIDHIRPLALGGEDHIENFRVLCRSCNQRAAIVNLGQVKMDKYLGRIDYESRGLD